MSFEMNRNYNNIRIKKFEFKINIILMCLKKYIKKPEVDEPQQVLT